MVEDAKDVKKVAPGIRINNINSIILATKKYAGGVSRKKAEDKWKKNVDNRSKVVKKK